jgi:hypothetical protein
MFDPFFYNYDKIRLQIFRQHKILQACDSKNVGPLETLSGHFI